MKYTLSLNSHQLSNFQRCETNFMLGDMLNLETAQKSSSFSRGTMVGRWLNLYYYNKIKHKRSIALVLSNPLLWTERIQKELKYGTNEAFQLYSVFKKYALFYKNETWKPVAIECGFSKVLYEDDENLFIYEGRVDLAILLGDSQQPIPVDHKTESANRPIYEFNNQAIGYMWAMDAVEFIYNYITLTKEPAFHRAVHTFTPAQIENWKANTIKWFFRLKETLRSNSFLPSSNCVNQYGKCWFTPICEQTNEAVKLHIIRSNYKQRKYKGSW